MTAPVAVIGALATALTAAPADAAEPVRAGTVPSPALTAAPPAHPVSSSAAQRQAATPVRLAAAARTSYTVRPGDTVSAIAIRNGLRPADVLAWNGLGWRSVIYPGQTLRLTAASPAAAAAKPAAKPASTTANGATHTVVRGDTVYAIARKYRTTVSQIIAANGLGSSAMIYPGQKLKVSAAPAVASTPKPSRPAATAAPAAAPTSHRVVIGDSLFAIAEKYGTSVAALLQANGLGTGGII